MRDFIRHRKKLAAVIALAALILAWWLSASVRGQLIARFDIARGHYQVLGYGLPVDWRPEYVRLLRQRYNIEFRAVAGCIVSESLVSYVQGYNTVSVAAANRKFGHDVFKECAKEAEKNWVQATSKELKE